MDAWLRFLGPPDPRFEREVRRELAHARVTEAPSGRAPELPGVVFFDRVTPEVAGAVRELSRSGRDRVLAIAASASVLDPADAWRLLAEGASDVFAWDH